MTASRNYSSVARLAALTAGITNSATTLPVDVATGFPTPPFTMVLDPGRSAEEIVTITAIVGLNLTATRGADGTPAQPHDAGAAVRHMATARDFREPAEHVGNTSAVHGVSGDLVGTLDDQILDNKTFQALVTDHTALVVQAATGQTADLVSVKDSTGAALAAWLVSGRMTGPGIDVGKSTFTASAAGHVPVIARGATSQTANLVEARNSADTVVAALSPTGAITTVGVATSTTSTTIPALLVSCIAAQTASAVSVRNSTATEVAGVTGETTGFQLFHGGSGSNLVPFKVHGGSEPLTMASGTTSISGSIDLSPYGFTVAPLMGLTVRQNNESTVQRRVAVTIEGAPTTTAATIRVHQSAADPVPSDTLYRVHWVAWQFTPTTSAG